MKNEKGNVLSLVNIREILMKGYKETLYRKKIVIEGIINSYDNKMLLTDVLGNSIGLYYSAKAKEKNCLFPKDGDKVTIEGYLNFGHEDELNVIEKGGLKFWFNIENILEIKESKSSKLQKIKKIISRKEQRYSQMINYLNYLLKSEKRAKIVILCSQTAEEDIKSGLAEESESFDIVYKNVPLSKDSDSEKLNLEILQVLNEGYDIIGFSRGGNENYDIFYNEQVIEKIVYAKEFTIAGIGHSNINCEFFDAFDYVKPTPIALGMFLRGLSLEVKNEKKLKQKEEKIKLAQQQREKTYIIIIAVMIILAVLYLFLL